MSKKLSVFVKGVLGGFVWWVALTRKLINFEAEFGLFLPEFLVFQPLFLLSLF